MGNVTFAVSLLGGFPDKTGAATVALGAVGFQRGFVRELGFVVQFGLFRGVLSGVAKGGGGCVPWRALGMES